ncbi:MAG: FAD-dependent oxidoreductase, partial [Acidimicrobiia bacterium]
MTRAVVVGGGLAGLFCAVELGRRGVEVTVVEAGDRPGGVAAGTIREDGYLLEPAGGTLLLPHPALSQMVEASGVEVVAAGPAAARRFVYAAGRRLGSRRKEAGR